MKTLWQPTLLAVLLTAAGCTTTTRQVVLTGNVMVDAPNAIANGPPRDRVLWEYRLAAATMRPRWSNIPARALPVPTSIPRKYFMLGA